MPIEGGGYCTHGELVYAFTVQDVKSRHNNGFLGNTHIPFLFEKNLKKASNPLL
jgi:hypothetical protein